MPKIETARLRYRMPGPHDLDAMMLIVSDPEVMKYLGVKPGTVLTREEAKNTLERMIEFWQEHGFGRWAVTNKEDDKLIGLCGFRLLDGMPELFYVFAKAWWGQGLATEAARALLRYGFEELGFESIVAAVRPANIASINVITKIGMSYEKKFSHYGINAVRYLITRDEYQVDDSPYLLS
jgi:RimJ/RimL family protein N-acetyltransferase